MADTETTPIVETEQAQPVTVEPVKTVKKPAKAVAVEADPELLSSYRKLKKAAQNVVELYEKTHTVNGLEDYRYPGLRDLAEALRA